MSDVTLAVKACTKCGETKPLSEFHRRKASPDGLSTWCKACATANAIANRQRQEKEMGRQAFRAHQREIVERHRQRSGSERSKAYGRARYDAIAVLIERHRQEFDHLLAIAKREQRL